MPELVVFDCEGCGDRVSHFGLEVIPKHRLCAVCLWLCEHVSDPEEFAALYQRIREGVDARHRDHQR